MLDFARKKLPAWWFTNFGFYLQIRKNAPTHLLDLAHALIWTRNEVNDSLLGSKNKNKFNLISAVAKNKLGSRRKKKLKVIDELKLFETELESVPEFGGFGDLFHSFELYRGKVSDDGNDENREVGAFKGGFKIYRMPVPKDAEQPDPVNGMFKGRFLSEHLANAEPTSSELFWSEQF